MLQLARAAIKAALAGEAPPAPCSAFMQPRGVFVSLHRGTRLRGCMGELDARRPLWEAVVRQARQAATGDTRFTKLTLAELDDCRLEISVLTPLVRTTDYTRVRLGTDGVYIVCTSPEGVRRSGCFLPQVADHTEWDVEQFLTVLCRDKARLPADAWRDPKAILYTFQAEVFSE